MATQYPQNTTYNRLMDMSQSLGESTRQAKARSAVQAPTNVPTTAPTRDIFQYQNLPKTLSDLGTQTVPYGGSTRYEANHPGIDIANKIGTPIGSFTGGEVTDVISGKVQGDSGYGNYAIITTPQGDKVRYSHLDQNYVRVGQQVKPGDILGTMGNTGQTYSQFKHGTGSHLDIRIKNAYNEYISPITYLRDYKYE